MAGPGLLAVLVLGLGASDCEPPEALASVFAILPEGTAERDALKAYLIENEHCETSLFDPHSQPGAPAPVHTPTQPMIQPPVPPLVRPFAQPTAQPVSQTSRPGPPQMPPDNGSTDTTDEGIERRFSVELGGFIRSGETQRGQLALSLQHHRESQDWRNASRASLRTDTDDRRADRTQAQALFRTAYIGSERFADPYVSVWSAYDSRRTDELRGFVALGLERRWNGQRLQGALTVGPGVLVQYDDDAEISDVREAVELRIQNRYRLNERVQLEQSVDFITDDSLELTAENAIAYRLSDPLDLRFALQLERDLNPDARAVDDDVIARLSIRYRLED